MAYVAAPQDQDPTKPIAVSTGAAGGTGAVGAGSVVARPTPTSSGSNFTNINTYLASAANRAGGQALGQQIAGDVSNEVNQANQAIDTGSRDFSQKVSENTNVFNPDAVNATINTGNVSDAVTRGLSGTYGGPRQLADTGARQTIDQEVQQATDAAELARTQAGRAQYIRQLTGRPMTAGESRLNSAFVNANPDAITGIESARQGATPLSGRVNAAETQAGNLATDAQATNAATRNQSLGLINTYLDQQNAALAASAAARRQQLIDQQNAITTYLNNIANFGQGRATIPTPPTRATAQDVPVQSTGRATTQAVRPGIQPVRNTGEQAPAATPAPAPAPSAPTPAPAPMALVPGWEQAGLTEDQARQLQTLIQQNYQLGGGKVDLAGYFTPGSPDSINANTQLTPELAQRLNVLAGLAGRSTYTPAAASDAYKFDYDRALAALNANVLANTPAPVAPAPVPAPAPAPAPVFPAPSPYDGGGGGDGTSEGSPGGDSSSGDSASSSTGSGADAAGGIGGSGMGEAGIGSTAGSGNNGGDDGAGDGGGGGGSGCVVATALTASGDWTASQKGDLVAWCEETLHDTFLGEALRRGYQVVGSKVLVPTLRKGGLARRYVKWGFEQATDLLRLRPKALMAAPHTILWVAALTCVGLAVSKRYATRCWKGLYE